MSGTIVPMEVEDVKVSEDYTASRKKRELLLSSYALLFSTYACATMLSAYFTPITRTLGISGTVNGLIFSSYPLGQSVSSLVAPMVVGRLGACNAVTAGLVLAGVLNVCFGLAPTMVGNEDLQAASSASVDGFVALSITFFFLTGCAAAVAETAVIMLVGNRFKDNAGKVMASINTACGVGCMIGPLIGGVLYDLAGGSRPGLAYRLPFFTMAAFLLLLSWPLRFSIDHDHLGHGEEDLVTASEAPPVDSAPANGAAAPTGHYARLCTPSVALGLGAIVLSGCVVGSLDPTLSYRMQAPPFWFSDSELATAFTLSSIVYSLLAVPVGWLCDQQPRNAARLKAITAVGFTALGLTFFVLAPFGGLTESGVTLGAAFNAPGAALFAMAIKGLGSASSTSAVYLDLGLGIGESEEALQSTMSSLWNAAYALGWSLGPLVGGALYAATDANELCLGIHSSCLNTSAPVSSAIVGGVRCECEWKPMNGFDGLGSVLTLVCALYTAALLLAAACNVRDTAPRAGAQPSTGESGVQAAPKAPTASGGLPLLEKLPEGGRTHRVCAAVCAGVALLVTMTLVLLAAYSPSSAARRAQCVAATTIETHLPGGPSRGLSYCIDEFVRSDRADPPENEYLNTIDGAKDTHALLKRLGCEYQPLNASVEWQATIQRAPWPSITSDNLLYYPSVMPGMNVNYTAALNRAAWVRPPDYVSTPGETRIVFVHGCNIMCSALGPYYLGFVGLLANWTHVPVLAFDFASDPINPWPNNIRSVLFYIHLALTSGPGGAGRAGAIFVLGDSEGTLVTTQTMMTLFDDTLRLQAGYGASLTQPDTWLAGVILSSPALDVSCSTPSMDSNCFNFSGDPNAVPTTAHTGTGDPDTGGDCAAMAAPGATIAEQGAAFKRWCKWTYLPYFFGLEGLASANTVEEADAFWYSHRAFFNLPTVNPLHAGAAELVNLPPFLMFAGTRDMYYSDAASLGTLMCQHGVDVEVYNAVGAYHDFIEYSLGCGGGYPMLEAVEAYTRIVAFMGANMHRMVGGAGGASASGRASGR